MKFRKAVSAFAALTLAISAFAGFGVTASAAADEGYKYGEVLYGVTTTEGDTITDVTVQTDFTENAETLAAATVFSGTTFLDGSVLLGSAGITKDFSAPVSSGKVHFAATYTVLGGNTNHIRLVDSDGNTVVGFYPVDSGSSNTINVMTVGGENVKTYIYTPRNVAYKLNDLTIDFDSQTYSYNMTVCSGGGSGTVNKLATISDSGTLSGVKDIAGIRTSANGSYAYRMDNMYLYSLESAVTMYDYTINYTVDGAEAPVKTASGRVVADAEVTAESVFEAEDGNRYYITGETAPKFTVTADGTNTFNVPVRLAESYEMKVVSSSSEETVLKSATVVEGDAFSYAYPKYITDANGKVIASTGATSFSTTITPAKSETITVDYTDYTGTAYFSEAEAKISATGMSNAKLSGGAAVRGFSDAREVLTIPEDGIYTLTTHSYTNNVNDDRVLSVYGGGTADENLIDTISLPSENTITKPKLQETAGIALTKDSVIYIKPGDTNIVVDYVLLTKTADLPVISAVSVNAVGETGATAVADPTEAYEVTGADAKAETASVISTDNMTVTTVYIKVDNAVDGVMPTVTFGGEDYVAQYTYNANNNSYYVYQFVTADEAATVTAVSYPNAATVTVE